MNYAAQQSANKGTCILQTDGEVMNLIQEAERLVRNASGQRSPGQELVLGGFRVPSRPIQDMIDAGYQFICGSVDIGLLRNAAAIELESVNDAIDKH